MDDVVRVTDSTHSGLDEGPSTMLKNEINISDLVSNREVMFELQDGGIVNDDMNRTYFRREDVNMEFASSGSAIGVDDNDDDSGSEFDGMTPFERLERKMYDVSDGEKLVLKRIIRNGFGDVVPQDACIRFHYNAHLEYDEQPYDSTYLRGKLQNCRLGEGTILPGLEIGLRTMMKEEIAELLVKPEVAFGEMGSGHRIPPNSVILFYVEMVDVIDDADAQKCSKMNPEERKNMPFTEMMKSAKAYHAKGVDQFKKGDFKGALNQFRNGKNLLENFNLKDADQETSQQHLLMKLCTNMAACQLRLGKAVAAIGLCHQAIGINHQCVKAYFFIGKAKGRLQEFEDAVKYMKKAQRILPNNQEINDAIRDLMRRKSESDYVEKSFCERFVKGLGSDFQKKHVETKAEEKKFSVSEVFSEYITKLYDTFNENAETKEINLPLNLSVDERGYAAYLAKQLDFDVGCEEKGGLPSFRITKRS